MSNYRVQILERVIYYLDVEADDTESAVDKAYELYGQIDVNNDDGYCDSTEAELVTNLDTGEKVYRA